MENMQSIRIFSILLLLLCSLLVSHSAIGLVNYDNHPDLLKAMEYDIALNGDDTEKADRTKAEYYYLRYLKDVNESFQKAAVYERLAGMYCANINIKKGEKLDIEKARDYYKKLLECEPNRIGHNTIIARVQLCSLDNPKGIERVKARIKMYNWLSKIDEKTLKDKWLPLRLPITKYPDPNVTGVANKEPQIIYPPDSNGPSESTLIGLKSLIDGLKETAVYNASYDAMSLDVPEEGFMYIFENLPPDVPERKTAEKIYKKSINRAANEVLKTLIPEDNPQEERVVVKSRFIPNYTNAKNKDLPFIFDFSDGKTINIKIQETLDDQKVYDQLNKINVGDLAFNGSLLATRDAKLLSVKEEKKRPLNKSRGKFIDTYKLPENVELPYTFVALDKESTYYLIKINTIIPEGIEILYRTLSTGEIYNYLSEKQN